jgi:hypothetical protein
VDTAAQTSDRLARRGHSTVRRIPRQIARSRRGNADRQLCAALVTSPRQPPEAQHVDEIKRVAFVVLHATGSPVQPRRVREIDRRPPGLAASRRSNTSHTLLRSPPWRPDPPPRSPSLTPTEHSRPAPKTTSLPRRSCGRSPTVDDEGRYRHTSIHRGLPSLEEDLLLVKPRV